MATRLQCLSVRSAVAGCPDLPAKRSGRRTAGSLLSPEVLEPIGADEPIMVAHVIGVLNEFMAQHSVMPIDIADRARIVAAFKGQVE